MIKFYTFYISQINRIYFYISLNRHINHYMPLPARCLQKYSTVCSVFSLSMRRWSTCSLSVVPLHWSRLAWIQSAASRSRESLTTHEKTWDNTITWEVPVHWSRLARIQSAASRSRESLTTHEKTWDNAIIWEMPVHWSRLAWILASASHNRTH